MLQILYVNECEGKQTLKCESLHPETEIRRLNMCDNHLFNFFICLYDLIDCSLVPLTSFFNQYFCLVLTSLRNNLMTGHFWLLEFKVCIRWPIDILALYLHTAGISSRFPIFCASTTLFVSYNIWSSWSDPEKIWKGSEHHAKSRVRVL